MPALSNHACLPDRARMLWWRGVDLEVGGVVTSSRFFPLLCAQPSCCDRLVKLIGWGQLPASVATKLTALTRLVWATPLPWSCLAPLPRLREPDLLEGLLSEVQPTELGSLPFLPQLTELNILCIPLMVASSPRPAACCSRSNDCRHSRISTLDPVCLAGRLGWRG